MANPIFRAQTDPLASAISQIFQGLTQTTPRNTSIREEPPGPLIDKPTITPGGEVTGMSRDVQPPGSPGTTSSWSPPAQPEVTTQEAEVTPEEPEVVREEETETPSPPAGEANYTPIPTPEEGGYTPWPGEPVDMTEEEQSRMEEIYERYKREPHPEQQALMDQLYGEARGTKKMTRGQKLALGILSIFPGFYSGYTQSARAERESSRDRVMQVQQELEQYNRELMAESARLQGYEARERMERNGRADSNMQQLSVLASNPTLGADLTPIGAPPYSGSVEEKESWIMRANEIMTRAVRQAQVKGSLTELIPTFVKNFASRGGDEDRDTIKRAFFEMARTTDPELTYEDFAATYPGLSQAIVDGVEEKSSNARRLMTVDASLIQMRENSIRNAQERLDLALQKEGRLAERDLNLLEVQLIQQQGRLADMLGELSLIRQWGLDTEEQELNIASVRSQLDNLQNRIALARAESAMRQESPDKTPVGLTAKEVLNEWNNWVTQRYSTEDIAEMMQRNDPVAFQQVQAFNVHIRRFLWKRNIDFDEEEVYNYLAENVPYGGDEFAQQEIFWDRGE